MEELRGSSEMQSTDDDQVFEITDFTTATDWERFIADFEDVLRKWDSLELSPGTGSETSKGGGILSCGSAGGGDCFNYSETVTLKFAKFVLIIRLYWYQGPGTKNKKDLSVQSARESKSGPGREEPLASEVDETSLTVFKDLMDFRYSFPHKAHCIYRWFGVKKFIVVSPMENNLITSEDRAKLLLSSAAIAMRNINVYIPVFVQIHHPQRKFFHGILEGSTSRIMFDMIHFREIPEGYRYLSELTKIFREKIASPFLDRVSIELSVRFTHILKDWPQEWISPEDQTDLEERLYSLDKLPMPLIEYPAPVAPIEELHLSTTWPKLSEEFINESPNFSNLNSMDAPYWSARALFSERITPTLTHSVSNLFILATSSKQSDQPLGKFASLQDDKAELEARSALDRLAGVGPPSLTLPQFRVPTATWTLSEELKNHTIEYLFAQSKYTESNEPLISKLLKDYRSFKSAPFNNLTWRLSIIFHQFKDLNTIAYLWTEIVKKLRDHWENLIDLPSLPIDSPDLGTGILNQKLQMLNCCIQQKRKRESILNKSGLEVAGRKATGKRTEGAQENEDGADRDSEDEFFDAIEDAGEFNEGKQVNSPEGRSHPLNDLKLMARDVPLYVPITQDPAPMTEDMMVEQIQILAQLGTSSEGAALRARMQSAHLISDMEAFKAANPGSILEDFVRWHSPRDFIVSADEGEEKEAISSLHKGQLSARMQTPGNMWREVWDSAKPVSVAKQKLLFDYTKEAEKILHSFASLTCIGLVRYLAPCLIHSVASQLLKRLQILGYSELALDVDVSEIQRCCSSADFDKCLTLLGNLETRLIKAETLGRLFTSAVDLETSPTTPDEEPKTAQLNWSLLNPFILGLTQEKEMEMADGGAGYLGQLMVKLFNRSTQALYEERTTVGERYSKVNSKSDLPAPIAKEYILRSTCPRPSITSKPLPQRMFALITPNEFRVSGAFCQDTLFR